MMGFRQSKLIGIVLTAALCAAPALYAEDKLFRYRDANGRLVINDTLPPEVVGQGYEVLSPGGAVLQVVPRQLSEEELAAMSEEEKAKRAAKAEEERLRAWDESLLMRYSIIPDIEASRDRAVRELNLRLSILRGNLLSLKRRVETEQAKAADIERRGKKVPTPLQEAIMATQHEIEATETAIEARKVEIDNVKAEYQRDIERFRYITEELGYRRR